LRARRRSVATAALLLALLVGAPAAQSASPYEINVLLPLTGSGAYLGKDEQTTLGLVESSVNKTGGIRGKQIHFAIQDDQSSPQLAVQLASALIDKGVAFFMGPSLAAQCNAIAPLTVRGTLDYCLSPTSHPPSGSMVFAAGSAGADYLLAGSRYMRERGWHKLAVLATNDASGQDAEQGLDAAIALPENKGIITVVDREHFNPTDIGVSAQLSRIKASGAQAALLYASGTPFGTVILGANQVGLDLPILTTSANLNYAQLDTYRSTMTSKLYMIVPPWAAAAQLKLRVAQNYLQLFDELHTRPGVGNALPWDSSQQLLGGLRLLGLDATGAQLRAYLADLHDWTGINGTYDFRRYPQRGIGVDSLYLVHWDPARSQFNLVSKGGGTPL
jgi:branched-chain amino acid transport system substrate-binding protein